MMNCAYSLVGIDLTILGCMFTVFTLYRPNGCMHRSVQAGALGYKNYGIRQVPTCSVAANALHCVPR